MLLSRAFRPWFLLATLQLADIVTTAIALTTRAAAREGNQTAAAIMAAYGQPAAYAVKVAGIAFVMFALWHYRHRRWARVTMWCAVGVTAWTVFNNSAFLAFT